MNAPPHPGAWHRCAPLPSNALSVPDDARSSLAFEGSAIRTVLLDGRMFLAASDACRALKLPIGGRITPAKYLRGIGNDDRGYHPFPTASGPQRCAIVSLAGALKLAKRRDRRIDRLFRPFINHQLRIENNA